MDKVTKYTQLTAKHYIIAVITFVIAVAAVIGSIYGAFFAVYEHAMFSSDAVRLNKADAYSKLASETPKNQIVFFGDSISEMYDLDYYYKSYDVVNRGIGGDSSLDMLNRIESNLFAIEPRAIVLLCGANDINRRTMEETIKTYDELVRTITERLPDCKIIIQTVYPVNNLGSVFSSRCVSRRTNAAIVELNTHIVKIAAKYKCTLVDMYSVFVNEEGVLNPALTIEGVHLNRKGYDLLTYCLSEHLSAL